RDAAGRGLSVVLCEKGDLAEGTSSRSGKYIHGGLRYLEYYEFRLVREALIEREVVLSVAPHLTRPLRLVLIHSPQQRPRWLIRLGLLLYDNLGGRKRIPATKAVDLKRSADGAMVRDTFTNAFAYYDVWVDDARLVILNALDAARRGAEVLTRTACVSARREDGLWRAVLRDTRTGEDRTVHARAIVNTAGPWVEEVLGNVAGVNTQKHVRLVKGSHIINKRWWEGDHGYVLQARDKRLIFVNPYFDDLALIGTTDIPYHDRPEDVAIDDDEITYLLEILNDHFKISLTEADVCDTYSGVRALFDDDSDKGASAVTRDYTFEVDGDVAANGSGGRAPILSAFGGKITTYRKLSEHALEKFAPAFPEMGGPWTAKAPLPGGDITEAIADFQRALQARYSFLSAPLAHHYAICYGREADTVLAGAKSLDDLGRHFGGLLYEREVRHLCTHEWAESADDILLRRTKHGLFLSKAETAALADWLEQADL
ncbi:MAG: glycerol-3-phosphate dehydrogenase, partial [Pseudomonadota bacterium]